MAPDLHILQQKWQKAVLSLGCHALHAYSVHTGNGTDLVLSYCRQGVSTRPATQSNMLIRLSYWKPRRRWPPPGMPSRQPLRMLPSKRPRGRQLSSSLLCCSRHCSRCVLLSHCIFCFEPCTCSADHRCSCTGMHMELWEFQASASNSVLHLQPSLVTR